MSVGEKRLMVVRDEGSHVRSKVPGVEIAESESTRECAHPRFSFSGTVFTRPISNKENRTESNTPAFGGQQKTSGKWRRSTIFAASKSAIGPWRMFTRLEPMPFQSYLGKVGHFGDQRWMIFPRDLPGSSLKASD